MKTQNPEPASKFKELTRPALVAMVVLLLSGCVTTNNQCGNEQRDWENLHFPKGDYCTLPVWMPFKESFERANKPVCKVHDNNTGIATTMSSAEADYRFLCDYIKRSEWPWGVRHASGYLSYFVVRLRSRQREYTPEGPVRNLHYSPR